eukprot:ANDGO_00962.mRNA.1 hypothetical protein
MSLVPVVRGFVVAPDGISQVRLPDDKPILSSGIVRLQESANLMRVAVNSVLTTFIAQYSSIAMPEKVETDDDAEDGFEDTESQRKHFEELVSAFEMPEPKRQKIGM